jgi:predicted small secreted protein
MSILEKLKEKTKQTYMSEEQQVTLSMFCDEYWNEVNGDYDVACSKVNIVDVLQHYVDTGGSIAGGYIHCVPNIINFVETHYDFYKGIHTQLKEKGLYKMDILEFLLTQYREFIFQTQHD